MEFERMSIAIHLSPQEPILLVEFDQHYDAEVDTEVLKDAVYDLYQAVQGPIYVITVGQTFVSLSESIISMNRFTHGDHRLTDLPLTLYAVLERHTVMMEALVRGMYGGVRVQVCRTIETALREIRAQAAVTM
jgi:hypothetical protein